MREYRKRYATRKNAKQREFRQQRKREAIAYLGGKCQDCGLDDHRILVFDHVRGVKECNVSYLLTKAWERLQKELDKCELVCANCHQIRTFERIEAQNVPDQFKSARLREACGRGHEYTEENTYWFKRGRRMLRRCRQCQTDATRARRKKGKS